MIEKAEIDSKIAQLSTIFSASKADLERELNETREKNAEVERELRSENFELRADLYIFQSRLKYNLKGKTKRPKSRSCRQIYENQTMTFLDLNGWSYLEQTASWYKTLDQEMTFDEAEAYSTLERTL
ncbi:unnamed protein product, partial [Mesorhabditis belari]|uniref:Uncharacterized protein n=1 Tax=Mesorhabditis belari TaxID=2138241 RepID=A0AAF3J8E0_9BILA